MGNVAFWGFSLGDRSGVSAHPLAGPMRQLVPRQVSGEETLTTSRALGNTPPGAVATLVAPSIVADTPVSAADATPCRARNITPPATGASSLAHPRCPPRRLMGGNVLA